MQFFVIIAMGMILIADGIDTHFVIAPGISGVSAIIFPFFALVLLWVRAVRNKIIKELESGRIAISLLQSSYSRGQNVLRLIAILGQFFLIFATDWVRIVQNFTGKYTAGLDEFIAMLPFVGWIVIGYFYLYPADRAIRESMIGEMIFFSEPVHPIWSRREYLLFQIRFQLLLVGLPLMCIVASKDIIEMYRMPISNWVSGILVNTSCQSFSDFVPDMLLGLSAGIVFLFAPFLVKFVWRCYSLPKGSLRDILIRLSKSVNLKFRDILLWPTYGVIVNAAVVGFVGRIRYIMLSDGLIESLTDGQIESVFGHEIGHIKHHHMLFYLFFAVGSMGFVGLLGYYLQMTLGLSPDIVQIIIILAIAGLWFLCFGYISRNFERQADLFAVKLLSREFDKFGCDDVHCLRHNGEYSGKLITPVCMSSAKLFGSALRRTAALNAIPAMKKSWRHGSISERCNFLIEVAGQPARLLRFELKIFRIKLILILSLIISLVACALTIISFGQ